MYRNILLLLILILNYYFSPAQSKSFEIYCEVYEGKVSFQSLNKVLPDSLGYLLPVIKKNQNISSLDLMNMLGFLGWQLVTSNEQQIGRSSHREDSPLIYTLKRKVEVSGKEYLLIQNRMKALLK